MTDNQWLALIFCVFVFVLATLLLALFQSIMKRLKQVEEKVQPKEQEEKKTVRKISEVSQWKCWLQQQGWKISQDLRGRTVYRLQLDFDKMLEYVGYDTEHLPTEVKSWISSVIRADEPLPQIYQTREDQTRAKWRTNSESKGIDHCDGIN